MTQARRVLRDPVILVTATLMVALAVPYLLPVLDEERTIALAEDYSDILFLSLALFAFQYRLWRHDHPGQRRFWHYMTAGFACWLLVRISYIAMPDMQGTPAGDISGDILYLGLYLAIILAGHTRPDREAGWSTGDLFHKLETAGAVIFAGVLLTYFVLVPSTTNYAAYDTWLPSLFMYVALDAFLALRFAYLARVCEGHPQRPVYLLIAATAVCWLITDALECLAHAGIYEMPLGTPLDLVWWPPFALVIVAARIKPGRSAMIEAGRPEPADPRQFRRRSVGPLVLVSFFVPIIHFSLYAFGLLDAESRNAREVVVFASLLLLGGMVLAHQILLERTNRTLRTDLCRANERLEESQKMQAVGQLAGGVAHDFNNLLTTITGHSRLLLQRLSDDDPSRGDVDHIDRAAGRAAELTRQLLAFSRRQILQPRVIGLNAVLDNLEPMLRRMAGENIALETCLATNLGRLRADCGQIEQVIVNLVVNAREAIEGDGRIEIVTDNVALESEDYVRLTVRDDGCGIDPAVQARIFEPFFTTRGQGEGTGLGLSTVYGIVSQSGGLVRFDSRPGYGSEFRIYLPQVEAPLDELPDEAAEPVGAPAGETTVLLAEDEGDLRELIREILETGGYRVLEASDGADALNVHRAHPGKIDLLLTDVVMPGLSGPELARRMEPSRPGIKVLYVSGYNEERLFSDGVDGEVAFLPKPFTPDALTAKVQQVLAG